MDGDRPDLSPSAEEDEEDAEHGQNGKLKKVRV
jgi:hypothetical protein